MKKLVLFLFLMAIPLVGYAGDSATTGVVGKIADSLTNDPSDCAANQFATDIDNLADLTCAAIVDADVPNDITIDLATTVTTNANLTGNVESVGNAATIPSDTVTTAMRADGTDGEIPTWDASGVADTVAVGTVGQILTSGGIGVAPAFQDAAGGGSGLSNVIYSEGWAKSTSESFIIDSTLNSDPAANAVTDFRYWARDVNVGFVRFYPVIRWIKIESVDTITFVGNVWRITAAGGNLFLRLDVGGETGDASSISSTTPVEVTAVVDVSSLSDGTTYDIQVFIRSGSGNSSKALGEFMLFGS